MVLGVLAATYGAGVVEVVVVVTVVGEKVAEVVSGVAVEVVVVTEAVVVVVVGVTVDVVVVVNTGASVVVATNEFQSQHVNFHLSVYPESLQVSALPTPPSLTEDTVTVSQRCTSQPSTVLMSKLRTSELVGLSLLVSTRQPKTTTVSSEAPGTEKEAEGDPVLDNGFSSLREIKANSKSHSFLPKVMAAQ